MCKSLLMSNHAGPKFSPLLTLNRVHRGAIFSSTNLRYLCPVDGRFAGVRICFGLWFGFVVCFFNGRWQLDHRSRSALEGRLWTLALRLNLYSTEVSVFGCGITSKRFKGDTIVAVQSLVCRQTESCGSIFSAGRSIRAPFTVFVGVHPLARYFFRDTTIYRCQINL
jgi:hypothetical protein